MFPIVLERICIVFSFTIVAKRTFEFSYKVLKSSSRFHTMQIQQLLLSQRAFLAIYIRTKYLYNIHTDSGGSH